MTRRTSAQEFREGWPVVLLAAIALGLGMTGVGFYSLGLFVTPLQQEFGWSRGAVSGAASFEQFGIFLSAPVVGRLADRLGARPIAIFSYLAAPLGFVALSFAGSSIVEWYALWLLVSLAGCGTTPAIWARLVSARFDAGRGLALGLMLMGTGLASILAPALLGPIVQDHGWRTAMLVIAAAIFVIGLPVSLLTPRENTAPRKADMTDQGGQRVKGRFEANRASMTLVAIALLLGLIVAGLIVHLIPMLTDAGMSIEEASGLAAQLGIAVLATRVIAGYLFDRFHAPFVAALLLISPAIACLALLLGGPVSLAAIMLGVAAGAEVDMLAYLTGRYVTLRNFGASYGMVLGVFSIGAACGPVVFGWNVDLTGSYDAILIVSAFLLALVVVAIATLGPYRTAE